MRIPIYIGNDLCLLYNKNQEELINKVKEAFLTDEEKDILSKNTENIIENHLVNLNQIMHENLSINPNKRVVLISGMIMAGITSNDVAPLEIKDFKGNNDYEDNDGSILTNKIKVFLRQKNMSDEVRNNIVSELKSVFTDATLWKSTNGESKLKEIFTYVSKNIIPYINPGNKLHLDFTGKLFNVLTSWMDIPDRDKNDVVLTPTYVADLMVKLCKVNRDSYVWDNAVGTGVFLVSCLKVMLSDADKNILNIEDREKKKRDIRTLQLLGIEKRSDIYMLGVLNMILMSDNPSNMIHADSLTNYYGNYTHGIMKGKPFPANVYLLNPPYSAEGNGFVFLEKALSQMKNGRAAVLIQENAGSGNGLPFTKRILKNNTLVASIHMANIFLGKSNVQTAIYLFDIGTPHDIENEVIFIDMTNDGYQRQDRKKAKAEKNLQDIDNAKARYQEVADIVLRKKTKTNFYIEGETIVRDCITLEGNDWLFKQHKKINQIPSEKDFKETVSNYLLWQISNILRKDAQFYLLSESDKEIFSKQVVTSRFLLNDIAELEYGNGFDNNKMTTNNPCYYFVSRTSKNNGISNIVDKYKNIEPFPAGCLTLAFGGSIGSCFLQNRPFYTGQNMGIIKLPNQVTNNAKIYFARVLENVCKSGYEAFSDEINKHFKKDLYIELPINQSGDIDYEYMDKYITIIKKMTLKPVLDYLNSKLKGK